MSIPSEATNGRSKVSVTTAENSAGERERARGEGVFVAASLETRGAGEEAADALTRRGYTPHLQVVEPANLEETVRALADPSFVGYVDLACGALADELLGEKPGLVSSRLKAAQARRLPAIAAPGGMDFVRWGARESVPAKYGRRKLLPDGPGLTRMRTDVTDNARLGRELADRLNGFAGPLAVLLPLRGLSDLSGPDGPFWSRETDIALFGNMVTHLRRDIGLYEANIAISDPAFAELCARTLQDLLAPTGG